MSGEPLQLLVDAYGKLGILIDDAHDAGNRLARQVYGTEVLPNWWVHARTVQTGLLLLQAVFDLHPGPAKTIAVIDRFLPAKNPRGRKIPWDRDDEREIPADTLNFRAACTRLRRELPAEHTFFVTSYPYEGRQRAAQPQLTASAKEGLNPDQRDGEVGPVTASDRSATETDIQPSFEWRHRGSRPLHRFSRALPLDDEFLRFGPTGEADPKWTHMIEDVVDYFVGPNPPVLVLAAESSIRTQPSSPGIPPPRETKKSTADPYRSECRGWHTVGCKHSPEAFQHLETLRRKGSVALARAEARRLRSHDFGFPQHLWLAARLPWGTVVNNCRDRCFRRAVRAATSRAEPDFALAHVRAYETRWKLEDGPSLTARAFEATAHSDSRWERSAWHRSDTFNEALRQALGFEAPRIVVWCGNTSHVESDNLRDLREAGVRVILISRSPTGALAEGSREFEKPEEFQHEPHALFHDLTVDYLRRRHNAAQRRSIQSTNSPPPERPRQMPRFWRAILDLRYRRHDARTRAWEVLRATEVLLRLNIAILCAELIGHGHQGTDLVQQWSTLFNGRFDKPELYQLWEALLHAARAVETISQTTRPRPVHPLPLRIALLVRQQHTRQAVKAVANDLRDKVTESAYIVDPGRLLAFQSSVLEPLAAAFCADGETWHLVHHSGGQAVEETDLGGWTAVPPSRRSELMGAPESDWLWLVNSTGHRFHLAPWVLMRSWQVFVCESLWPLSGDTMVVFNGREREVVSVSDDHHVAKPVREFFDALSRAQPMKRRIAATGSSPTLSASQITAATTTYLVPFRWQGPSLEEMSAAVLERRVFGSGAGSGHHPVGEPLWARDCSRPAASNYLDEAFRAPMVEPERSGEWSWRRYEAQQRALNHIAPSPSVGGLPVRWNTDAAGRGGLRLILTPARVGLLMYEINWFVPGSPRPGPETVLQAVHDGMLLEPPSWRMAANQQSDTTDRDLWGTLWENPFQNLPLHLRHFSDWLFRGQEISTESACPKVRHHTALHLSEAPGHPVVLTDQLAHGDRLDFHVTVGTRTRTFRPRERQVFGLSGLGSALVGWGDGHLDGESPIGFQDIHLLLAADVILHSEVCAALCARQGHILELQRAEWERAARLGCGPTNHAFLEFHRRARAARALDQGIEDAMRSFQAPAQPRTTVAIDFTVVPISVRVDDTELKLAPAHFACFVAVAWGCHTDGGFHLDKFDFHTPSGQLARRMRRLHPRFKDDAWFGGSPDPGEVYKHRWYRIRYTIVDNNPCCDGLFVIDDGIVRFAADVGLDITGSPPN